MAIDSWIDEITRMWGTLVWDGKQVRSYAVVEKNEFPETLSEFPSVITYPQELRPEYSEGGPCADFWTGVSEFHMVSSVQKVHIPKIVTFIPKIRTLAAAHMKLSGKVNIFQLDKDERPGIQGPVNLKYGEEAEHLGLLVNWRVKDDVTGQFPVSQ